MVLTVDPFEKNNLLPLRMKYLRLHSFSHMPAECAESVPKWDRAQARIRTSLCQKPLEIWVAIRIQRASRHVGVSARGKAAEYNAAQYPDQKPLT